MALESTLLDTCWRANYRDSGHIDWVDTVEIDYYDQESGGLGRAQRRSSSPQKKRSLIRQIRGYRMDEAANAGMVLVHATQAAHLYRQLSVAAKRRRLYLLHTLIARPNVPFLDEPN
ncbi:MAG: hypothetical protein M5U34_39620 [Chloroflexi bacterium]|nr:hypothetical protein [Chloroflexota bacterium]